MSAVAQSDGRVSKDHDTVDGLRGIHVGSEVVLLTWLDRATRDVLVAKSSGRPRQFAATP